MRTLFILIIGILLGLGIYWYIAQPNARHSTETATGSQTNEAVTVRNHFDPQHIKEELNRTGKVIREKSAQAGQAFSEAADNARITAAIKARLIRDSGLSAFKIDVDTNDRVVTLSGVVKSYDQVAQAMQIALDTDGVQKVISTIQVKS